MIEWIGTLPDWAAAGVAFWGLKIANDHFNKQPKPKFSVEYNSTKRGDKPKEYIFWAVNDGNLSMSVRFIGIKLSGSKMEELILPDIKQIKWQYLQPGQASDPIRISFPFIANNVLKRIMDDGDVGFIDVLYENAHEKIESIRVRVTKTMVRDNSKLPKAPHGGKYLYPTDVGKK